MSTFTKLYTTSDANVGGNLSITGTFAPASITLSATSNQITMGTTNTTTISATAPGASSTYTIPDVGTTGNFILSSGAQSITGVKTLTTPRIFDVGGGANTYNVAVSTLAAARTITLPLLGGNDTFVFESHGATLSNKTLATPVITGQATAPLGTAGAPTYSFTGDVNTGIFSSGADAVDIATNGVSRLTVSNTGVSLVAGSVLSSYNISSVITPVAGATLVITSSNASKVIVATGTGLTITLPTGAAFNGITYTIIRANATGNTVINTSGGDFIDNVTDTSLTLTTQFQRVSIQYIQSLGIWFIV